MDRLAPYMKAVVAALTAAVLVIGAIAEALTDAGVSIPSWLSAVFAAIAALGVFLVRNAPEPPGANHRVPRHERLDEDPEESTSVGGLPDGEIDRVEATERELLEQARQRPDDVPGSP